MNVAGRIPTGPPGQLKQAATRGIKVADDWIPTAVEDQRGRPTDVALAVKGSQLGVGSGWVVADRQLEVLVRKIILADDRVITVIQRQVVIPSGVSGAVNGSQERVGTGRVVAHRQFEVTVVEVAA
jgi:hypothetical protein